MYIIAPSEEMKSQLSSEAKAESETYDKMMCWCQTSEKEMTLASLRLRIAEGMTFGILYRPADAFLVEFLEQPDFRINSSVARFPRGLLTRLFGSSDKSSNIYSARPSPWARDALVPSWQDTKAGSGVASPNPGLSVRLRRPAKARGARGRRSWSGRASNTAVLLFPRFADSDPSV